MRTICLAAFGWWLCLQKALFAKWHSGSTNIAAAINLERLPVPVQQIIFNTKFVCLLRKIGHKNG
jgi:hypothetical protein